MDFVEAGRHDTEAMRTRRRREPPVVADETVGRRPEVQRRREMQRVQGAQRLRSEALGPVEELVVRLPQMNAAKEERRFLDRFARSTCPSQRTMDFDARNRGRSDPGGQAQEPSELKALGLGEEELPEGRGVGVEERSAQNVSSSRISRRIWVRVFVPGSGGSGG